VGARKIVRFLERQGAQVPSASTVHAILQRHGQIDPPPGGAPASQRFEKSAPNQLWQMISRAGCAWQCHDLPSVNDD
jgi:putative transposase